MEAVYLLFAFTITFGVGAAVGFATRGLIAKEIDKASAEFKSVLSEVKAEVAKVTAKL